MKADPQTPVTEAPSAAHWRPAFVEQPAEPRATALPGHLAVCLECRYAELFAVQPRARCICPESDFAKQVVFAGRPACAQMMPREGDDLTLAWCTPGPKRAHTRFTRPRPPVH
jgi:hypothetical protein